MLMVITFTLSPSLVTSCELHNSQKGVNYYLVLKEAGQQNICMPFSGVPRQIAGKTPELLTTSLKTYDWGARTAENEVACNEFTQSPLQVWTVKLNKRSLDGSRPVYQGNKQICRAPVNDICGQQVSGYKEYWRSFQCPNGIGRTVCEVK